MTKLHPVFLSAIAFFVVLAAGGAFTNVAERRHADAYHHMTREIGSAHAHLLERQLDRSLSSTFALASIVHQSGRIDNFDALAAEIIKSYGGINSLQLAPNSVVTQIYPLAGNEAAIGHDLLNDPRRRTEAWKAIESRTLTLAGPFTLIQGGVAVIGRLPVFVPDETGGDRFWGFTIALIHLADLLEVSKLNRLVERGYDYELSRIDPDRRARVVFARSAKADLRDAIPFEIEVPNGRWTLAVAPRGGWPYSSSLPGEIVLVVLASSAVAGLIYYLVRQPAVLRREVEFRTQELTETSRDLEAEIVHRKRAEQALRVSEEQYRDLYENAPDMFCSVDAATGAIARCNRMLVAKTGYAKEEILSRHIFEMYHLDCLEDAKETFQEFQEAGEVRDRELQLRRKDGSKLGVSLSVSAVRDEEGRIVQSRSVWRDITERKRADEALRESEAALRKSEKGLHMLTGKLLSAQEEERRRLARELHDDLTQRLAVLAIEAGKLEQHLESSGDPIVGKLRKMKEQVVKLSADVHVISRQLHPSILDDLGLVNAIEAECSSFSQREGISVKYEPQDVPPGLPRDVALCLYRIAQEGLRNIAKHAQTKKAHISLAGNGSDILLSIEDAGVGFDPAHVRGKAGLGLASMEERARLVEGELFVQSRPGQGTAIEVRVPLTRREV
ncbi:MAG: PAS domain S-box protein [Candidatus Methylomirabilales bacterium]